MLNSSHLSYIVQAALHKLLTIERKDNTVLSQFVTLPIVTLPMASNIFPFFVQYPIDSQHFVRLFAMFVVHL